MSRPYSVRNLGITIADSAPVAIEANEWRKSVLISPPDAGQLWISFGEKNFGDRGIRLNIYSDPLLITREHVGDLISQPIWLRSEDVQTAYVLEVSSPCCRRQEVYEE